MGILLDFFAGGPARIKMLLVGALVMAGTCASLLAYGLWWRADAYQARAQRDVAMAQIKVLGAAVDRCTASVERVGRAGDEAVKIAGAMLKQAERLAQPAAKEIARLEELLKKPAPPGANCDTAWDALEIEYRNAGAPR